MRVAVTNVLVNRPRIPHSLPDAVGMAATAHADLHLLAPEAAAIGSGRLPPPTPT